MTLAAWSHLCSPARTTGSTRSGSRYRAACGSEAGGALRKPQPRTHLKGEETDMGVLTGKAALVTGASRGIGRAIAERLGELGASVAVNYSSSEEAAQECVAVIEKTGARAVAIKADMADVDEIHALFASAKQALGDIDIAVANAGLEIVDVATVDFTEDQFDRAFAINTKGTFFTLQHAAR